MNTHTEDHYIYVFEGDEITTYRNDLTHDMVYVETNSIQKFDEVLQELKDRYPWDKSSIKRLEDLVKAHRAYHREYAIDQILD